MMNKMKQGFTLIELMIVVAVIGVLAAIAIPKYQDYVKKSELGAALASISALKTGIESYIADKGAFPPNSVVSEIGATGAPTGFTISLTPGTSEAGYVKAAKGSAPAIGLVRDSQGIWTCKAEAVSAIIPRGC
ncbi:MAG: pilin, partial [Plesiomonas sp.]